MEEESVEPLWSLCLQTVLPTLAEIEMETFCQAVFQDKRVQDRMRQKLLYEPRRTVQDLADTDLVELYNRTDINDDIVLIHLGALPFRVRQAIKRMFHETVICKLDDQYGAVTSDGRFQLVVGNCDEGISQSFEELQDAYIRALERTIAFEAVPSVSSRDLDNLDITEEFGVQEDCVLYDAHRLALTDEDDQIREDFLQDCLDFFSEEDPFPLPETVEPQKVSTLQVWVRKPRVRLVLGSTDSR